MSESIAKPRRRVKSGCKTCKARRVKCDESRPACRRCLSTGRACEGYGIWGGGGSPYGQPQSNRALSVYCTPIPAGSLTADEQVSFDWFMERTAKKFAGLFTSDFWETLVFQASAQEPAVRHAIVALSAAHRYDSNYGPWMIPTMYGFDAEQFTLQQYNKAIKCLRAPGGNSKKTTRVALITCLIFVTLEYLRGQYQMGAAHLRYGIQLLSEMSKLSSPRSSIFPKILSPAEDFAHKAIIDSYARLITQSALFGYIPPHLCVMIRDPLTNALPYKFSSMVEARQSLDDLLNRIHCLEQHSNILKSAKQAEINDQELITIQQNIISDLILWRKIHTATYIRQTQVARQYQFGSILLRVYHEMATIMALVLLSPSSEMAYDDQTPHFLAIITGFFELWKCWTTTSSIQRLDITELMKSPECKGNGFTVESGFIPPIYYTALKCRVPKIRRQAIRTLRSAPHREGVWNGLLLADVLEVVLAIEEGDFYEGDSFEGFDGPMEEMITEKELNVPKVPEERRLSDVKVILPDKVASDTFVSYKKIVDGKWVTFEKKVEPGVLRGWKLHREGPEVTIGGLWKGMSQ
ncbi:uncharacterized protein N7477_001536 [Penicillium maclennaniae]|uniref:uncharacterized protein n=1 Tax=Penicillium maclennaniae TaxID=1343394 RepID=UPI002540AADF|nr:uncharacterized protein N7477_001536 [Penicillium maclennaniae]KAJ5681596.1 hypothetical protein N7477_001536 [Penicillium maclennaniae]